MLKFFRKYNKQILVVGGVLLMVVFLIQPAISIFMPTGAGRVVATIDGEDITAGERQRASSQLALLRRLSPIFAFDLGDEPLAWIKLQRRANELSLSASESEILFLLEQLNVTDEQLGGVLRNFETTLDTVHATVGAYLAAAKYYQLATGRTGRSPVDRLLALYQGEALRFRAQQMLQQGQGQMARFMMSRAQQVFAMAEGHQRLSEAAVRHAIRDIGSTVGGRLVVIPAAGLVGEVDAPSEQELRELFERYRDDLPGEGEPYGFGYRIPDRIRIEWLSVSRSDVAETIEVDEADAVAYYREHRERFPVEQEEREGEASESRATPAGPFPTFDVRERVIAALRTEQAEEEIQRIVRAARNLLREPLRPLEEREGYKVLPEGFVPPPLEEVATRLEENYGVAVSVSRATDSWTPLRQIGTLGAIARSVLADRQPPVAFSSYVSSARELEPAPDNALVPLGLQVGVPSEPLRSAAGDRRFVFRLTDAQAGRVPTELDAVRGAVEADARRLAAFRMLRESASRWAMQARADGLEAVAEESESRVRELSPRPRIVAESPGGDVSTDPELLASMFELAAEVGPRTDPSDLTPAERITTVALPRHLALGVFELTSYQPVTRERFAEQLRDEMAPALLASMIDRGRAAAAGPWIRQLDIGEIERRASEAEAPSGPNPSPNRPGRPTGL